MPQIIEWLDPSSENIIYRYPDENITWGAQLVVHEYEIAVFFRDGKAYDVFGAGRHVLTTLNIPLITGPLSKIAGYDQKTFKASIVFVSTRLFTWKYGIQGQTTDLAPLKAFISFYFKIENAQLFVNEVVDGQKAYSTEDVNNYLHGFLNERIIDELSHCDLLTAFTKLDETSMIIKNSIMDQFKRIGLELTDLRFESIDTTPEYRERLFWIRTGKATPEEVLRMETVRKSAEELGKSTGGAGFGTGIVLIPQIMTPSGLVQVPSAALTVCPKCNAKVPATSKFCSDCGAMITPLSSVTTRCAKCNKTIPTNSKFCPECDTKLS